jgi:putative spermidine/putrescine transport system substrate-binding protein
VEFVSYLGALIDIHVRLSPPTGWCADRQPRRRLRARGRATVMSAGRQRGQCSQNKIGNRRSDMSIPWLMINRRPPSVARALAAVPPVPRPPRTTSVIVGTWGGDYSRLLEKNIEAPLPQAEGLGRRQGRGERGPPQVQDHGREGAAPRHRRRLGFSSTDMFELGEQGVVETIDYSKMPNAKNLIPSMKYPYGIGHIYSGKVVLYNPKLMAAPTGFADTLDPKHGNKLGLIDIQYQYIILAAALASGGSVSNYEPAKERLAGVQEGGRAHLSEQRGVRPGAQDRGDRLRRSCGRRAPCSGRTPASRSRRWRPKEGRADVRLGLRDAEERAQQGGRYAYLDAMMASRRRRRASRRHGIQSDRSPTPSCMVPDDVAERSGFTDEEKKLLVDLRLRIIMAKERLRVQGMVDKSFKERGKA